MEACGGGDWSSLHVGCTCATVFMRSGISLLLTSCVALQTTKMCSDDSTGALQSWQAGLMFCWSRLSLSLVRKSPVRNFRCSRSFLTSWVVLMLRRQGCGAPDLSFTLLRPFHPGWELNIQLISFTFDHPVYHFLLITLYLARVTTTTTRWVMSLFRCGYVKSRGGYVKNRGGYVQFRGGYVNNFFLLILMATYVSACSPRAAHALRSDQLCFEWYEMTKFWNWLC